MKKKINEFCQLLFLTAVLLGATNAQGKPLQTIPIDQIKPGMKGYGLTVFYGYKIERFQVEVLDVLHNFLPKQDLFLVRVDHPRLRKTGVVGGMSGSPIYLDGGKLAGALAYGWRFAKEPIAGITPIGDMLDLVKRPTRGRSAAGFAANMPRSGLTGPSLARKVLVGDTDAWWRLPGRPLQDRSAMLTQASVPLNAAGFSTEAMQLLRQAFTGYGMDPVQGGGTATSDKGPDRFAPGSALGVQLVSGDMSLSGTGTVTWVDDNKVLGFGHRMFNAGEIYVPVASARINHTLANVARSIKISSPGKVLGTLVQDRQAGIYAQMSRSIDTVPMSVTLRFQGKTHRFNAQLAHHRLLTPTLATTVLSSALSHTLADVAHATFNVKTDVEMTGHKPLRIRETHYASSGLRMTAVLFSRGLRALSKLLNNSFQPVQVKRINVDLEANFRRDVVTIAGVHVGSSSVAPGDRVNLTVSFRPFDGKEFTRSFPLQIPRNLAGSVVVAEVAGGDRVSPEIATPQNLDQMLRNLQIDFPARSLVVTLKVPSKGIKIRGQVIRNLPTSILDTLNSGTQTRSESLFNTALHEVHGTSRVVLGRKQLRIRVRPSEVTP